MLSVGEGMDISADLIELGRTVSLCCNDGVAARV
jgi:pseudouridine-5'-phosphate glycosidase